jgi:hypothetical protein
MFLSSFAGLWSILHNSSAPLSTSHPQMTYLFMKCSVKPLMFSLMRRNQRAYASHSGKVGETTKHRYTDRSLGVRSSSLSSSWSIGVSGSIRGTTSRVNNRSCSQAHSERGRQKGRETYQSQTTALLHSAMHPVPQRANTSHLDEPVSNLLPPLFSRRSKEKIKRGAHLGRRNRCIPLHQRRSQRWRTRPYRRRVHRGCVGYMW